MQLTDLLQVCQAWKGSPDEFSMIVRETIESLHLRLGDLAHQFEVAESTVSRWAAGTVKPHPMVQKHIVRKLCRRVRDAVDAERQSYGGGGLTPAAPPAYPMAARGPR